MNARWPLLQGILCLITNIITTSYVLYIPVEFIRIEWEPGPFISFRSSRRLPCLIIGNIAGRSLFHVRQVPSKLNFIEQRKPVPLYLGGLKFLRRGWTDAFRVITPGEQFPSWCPSIKFEQPPERTTPRLVSLVNNIGGRSFTRRREVPLFVRYLPVPPFCFLGAVIVHIPFEGGGEKEKKKKGVPWKESAASIIFTRGGAP